MLLEVVQKVTYGYNYTEMSVDAVKQYVHQCIKLHHSSLIGITWCSLMSWMSIDAQVVPWCTRTIIWMIKMTLNEAGCLGCLSMHKLCLDATKHLYGWPRWPSTLYLCTSCSLMHQNIYWDDQDDPHCSWLSWMLVVNKLCFEAPLGIIWMLLTQLDSLDVYGCPRCPSKQLENLELHWCIHFALMHQCIYMDDQDDPWCIWMSIVAQVVSRCTKGFIWMLKMTL